MEEQTQNTAPPKPSNHEEYLIAKRKGKRRNKHAEDDVDFLNITPMLDMMTIILVFLLKSFSASSGFKDRKSVV